MQDEQRDVINSLNQAIDAENADNVSAGLKNTVSDINDLKKKIITWLKRLPCVGFKSRSYDLNVLGKKLNPILLKTNKNLSPIKRGNCFLAMTTPELAFLDLKNYLAPNYLLVLFIEHYGATETKGSFPYKLVKSVSDFYKPGLPTRTDFYSSLQGETISVEAYDIVEQAWCSNEMRTF